jgi:Cu(I)/Ag(I) efflux system protein CusF
MKSLFPAVSLLALLVANPVLAAGEHDSHHPAGSSAASVKAAASEGTVKKVDKAAGKITIKHGPLANLGMPPMTMAFRVSDPGDARSGQGGRESELHRGERRRRLDGHRTRSGEVAFRAV